MRRIRFHGNRKRTFLTCQQSIRKGSSRVSKENIHSANSRSFVGSPPSGSTRKNTRQFLGIKHLPTPNNYSN